MTRWASTLTRQASALRESARTHTAAAAYCEAATILDELARAGTRQQAIGVLDQTISTHPDGAVTTVLVGCRASLTGNHYAIARAANEAINAHWPAPARTA